MRSAVGGPNNRRINPRNPSPTALSHEHKSNPPLPPLKKGGRGDFDWGRKAHDYPVKIPHSMMGNERGEERVKEDLRERLEELRGKDLTDAEVEAEVQRLLAVGGPAVPVILDLLTDGDETLLAVASQTLKSWGEPRPVEQLLKLLRHPDVSDLAKALILNVLEKYGLEVDGPELLGLGIDLEDYQINSRGNGGNGTEGG